MARLYLFLADLFSYFQIKGVLSMRSLPIDRVFALSRVALVLGLLAATGSRALAQTFTWNSSGGTAWSTAGNWFNGSVPSAGSVVLFQGLSYATSSLPNTNATPQSVGAIWDTGGSMTINGGNAGVLTLTGTTVNGNLGIGIEMDSGAGSLGIKAPLALGGPQTWMNNSNLNALSITGSVTGGTANSLTVTGSSIVSLGNVNNSFSGNITVSGGTLQAATGNNVANPSTTVLGNPKVASRVITVDDGGVLQLTAGAIFGSGGNTVPMLLVIGPSGLVTNNAVGGSANNSLGVVQLSGGTLNGLKGGANGPYWTWQLTGGSVQVMNNPSLITITATSGGTDNGYNMAATTTFNVAPTVGPGYDLTVSAPMVDVWGGSNGTAASASLVKTGAGTMVLTSTDFYSGTTTVNNGTLVLGNTAAVLDSYINTSGTGTLSFGTLASATFGGLSGSGALALTNSGATAPVALTVGNLTLLPAGTITYGGTLKSTTFSGALTDGGLGGSLTKVGTASLTMTGNNTYNGPTLVNNGALVVTGSLTNSAVTVASGALFSGTNAVVGGLAVSGSAILAGGSATITGAGGLTVNTGGTAMLTAANATIGGGMTLANGGTATLSTGNATIGGPFSVNSGGVLTLNLGNSAAAVNVGSGNGLMTLSDGTASFYGPGNYAVLNYTLSSNGIQPINLGSGTLAINPGGVFVNLNFATSPVAGTTYPLINFGTQNVSGSYSLDPFSPFVTSLMYGRDTYSLVDNANSLAIQVTGPPVPGVAYFYGAVSNVWNDLSNSTSCNWSLDAAGTQDALNTPGVSTDVIFSATNLSGSGLTTSLGGSTTINSLNITAAPGSTTISDFYTLTINALADSNTNSSGYMGNPAGNGISIAAGAGPVTLDLPVALGGSQTWTNNSANTLTVTVNGSITGTAISGVQTLTLSAAGSGGISVNGPISNGTLGGSLALVVNSGGSGITLLAGSNTYSGGTDLQAGYLMLGNSAALSTGALQINSGTLDLAGFSPTQSSLNGASGIITNSNTAAAALTVSSGNYSGTINDGQGTVALVKTGSGTLVLTGANNYSGGTTLAGGNLVLSATGQVGSGLFNFDGGTLVATAPLSFPATTSVQLNATSTISTSNSLTFAGPLTNSGTNTINLTGSGTVSLNAVNISNNLNQGSLFHVATGVPNTTLILNGTIADSASGATTPGSSITLTPQAAGVMFIINGSNTFSGTSSLGGNDTGIIVINNNAAFGTSLIQLNKTALEAGSGAVTLANSAAIVSSPDSIQGSGGFPFTFAGPMSVTGTQTLNNNSNGLLTLSNNVYLTTSSSNANLTIGGSGNITISGPIADNNGFSGKGGLIYNGSAVLALSGSDTYSNGTTIDSGTLTITPSGSISDSGGVGLTLNGSGAVVNLQGEYSKLGTGSVVIEGGATLNISGSLVSMNGNNGIHLGQTGPGTLNVTSGGIFFSTPNSFLQVGDGSGGTLNLTGGSIGIVSPASGVNVAIAAGSVGVLNVSGSGVLDISANSFQIGGSGDSGTINLGSGGLIVTNQPLKGSTGTSTLNFSGGTLQASANSANFISGLTAANIQDGGATIDDGGFAITINQNLLAAGSGGLTKVDVGMVTLGGSNTYTGGTTISAGTLQLGNGGSLGSLSTASAIVDNGTLSFSRSNTMTQGVDFSGGAISGSGALVQVGPGTVVLNANNMYTGGTNINGGILQFANTSAMPSSGTVTVAGNAVLAVNAGGANEFTNATSGPGSIGGLLAGIGGQGAPVNWNFDALFGIDTTNASGGNLTYSGSIADTVNGPLGLIKLGGGILTLTASNSYSDGTTVSGGTLQLGNTGALGTGGLTASAGVADLAGFSPTVTTFNGRNGAVTSSAGSATLTVTSGGVFSGTIEDDPNLAPGTAPVGLVLTGGELSLTGTNTYSGGTLVTGGELVLGNAGALERGSSLIVGQDAVQVLGISFPSVASAGIAQTVPEPGTLALLIACGVVAAAGAWRRSRSGRP